MGLTHLLISISGSEISFNIIKNDIPTNSSFVLISDLNNVKEELESHLNNSEFLTSEFDNYFLSYSSNQSTLVPNNIFAESSAKSIHKLCFGNINSTAEIDYNRIAEVGVVNVFSIGQWIKRFFILKYPRINIQHEGSFIVRNMLNKNSFKLKIVISLHSGYFQLSIVQQSKLEFYSFFDFQNDEDILYHLMFVLQQKEMLNEKGRIELIQFSNKHDDLIEKLQKNITRIKEIKQLEVKKVDSYIQKAQLLCV